MGNCIGNNHDTVHNHMDSKKMHVLQYGIQQFAANGAAVTFQRNGVHERSCYNACE